MKSNLLPLPVPKAPLLPPLELPRQIGQVYEVTLATQGDGFVVVGALS
jgi:hypothetical protein